MREIKFRAWYDGSYWPLRCLDYLGNGDLCNIRLAIQVDEDDWDFPSVDPKEVTLQQYTGLKDKNGKEIYEGDIVEVLYTNIYRNFQVLFLSGAFCLCTEDNEYYDDICNCENVIGNIHENPELLNE